MIQQDSKDAVERRAGPTSRGGVVRTTTTADQPRPLCRAIS